MFEQLKSEDAKMAKDLIKANCDLFIAIFIRRN